MVDLLKRSLGGLLEIAYGVYALAVFTVCGLAAFVLVLAPLGVTARRYIAHAAARAFFFTAGMPIRLLDSGNLPAGPCVVVANHASYLDGVVLKAALPARFCFVIKKEVSRAPLAGLLLRRIGSEFVDRFNRHAGGLDARRLIKAAHAGQALAFFPEGTFLPQPGLGKFHSGAFTIAVRAELPVAPVVIRGTRRILPSGRYLPRPGAIDVHVLPALDPTAGPANADAPSGGEEDDQNVASRKEPSGAIALVRERSRARILAALGEPDLAQNDGVAALQERRP